MIKKFLFKFWIWNLLIDILIFVFSYGIFVLILAEKITNLAGIILVLALLILLSIHAIILFIFFIKHLFSRHFLIALLLIVHIACLYPVARFLFLPLFLSLGSIGY